MPYRVVVPVSGGKDSQACLKLALQHYPADEVLGLFCDTKYEHTITYRHIETIRQLYGVRIDVVNNGSVEEQILKHGRFPQGGARFCTEELKIWPAKRYYNALALAQGSRLGRKGRGKTRAAVEGSQAGAFEVWYGMRLEESTQRRRKYTTMNEELYEPHEVLAKYPQYLGKLGVRFRLAVLDWSEDEVFDFLDGEENPLYKIRLPNGKRKFTRIGCFPCEAAGDEPRENALPA